MITLAGSSFTNNVSPIGAIIYAISGSMIQHMHSVLLIDNNMADRYAVIYLSDSEFIGNDSGNVTYSNNLMAFNSNITFTGHAIFLNNQPRTVSGDFQQGGAVTLLQSNIFFDGVCNLEHNHAENGGAIHSTESKLYVNDDVTIVHNRASGNGGGVYLSTSELPTEEYLYTSE
jgi:predicted outer membrane repeat protein